MRARVYQLGHRLDSNDPRDYIVSMSKQSLPTKVDLRPKIVNPLRDQGNLGACTGFAGAGHREYLWYYKQKQVPCLLSPLFLYYQTRLLDGMARLDNGATLRDIMKTLKKFGACPEDLMPYHPEDFRLAPDDTALGAALPFRIDNYSRLTDIPTMQQVLAQQETFVIGIPVYESLESAQVRKSGVVTLPRSGEVQIGGHALHVVGYLPVDGKMYFIVANSWGTDWGKRGYGFLPFAYLNQMPYDAWMASVDDENQTAVEVV